LRQDRGSTQRQSSRCHSGALLRERPADPRNGSSLGALARRLFVTPANARRRLCTPREPRFSQCSSRCSFPHPPCWLKPRRRIARKRPIQSARSLQRSVARWPIKAHPKAAGSGPYAQVQRDYYQDCIAKGGICRTEPRSMSAAATAVPVATIAQIPITQLAHANGLRCWACACLRRSRHAIPIR
jgi:hypothetical protein